ncbi:MAG: hypothetical protein M1840_005822 [Geoglossum simile]|nr:MAG: hypothetical protein M1840_005822 [Geoglossum simile]
MHGYRKRMVSGVRAKEIAEKYEAAVVLLDLAGAMGGVAPQRSPRMEAAWLLMSLAATDRALGWTKAPRALTGLSKTSCVTKPKRVPGWRGNAGTASAVPAATLTSSASGPRVGAVTRLLTRKGVAPAPPHPATVDPNGLPRASTGAGVSKVAKTSGNGTRRNVAGRFASTTEPPAVRGSSGGGPGGRFSPTVSPTLDILAAVAATTEPPAVPEPVVGSAKPPVAAAPAAQTFVPIHTRPFAIPASVARGSTGHFHFYARAPPDQERFIVLEKERGMSVKDIARALFPDDDAATHRKRRSWIGNRWLGYAQAWHLSSKAGGVAALRVGSGRGREGYTEFRE